MRSHDCGYAYCRALQEVDHCILKDGVANHLQQLKIRGRESTAQSAVETSLLPASTRESSMDKRQQASSRDVLNFVSAGLGRQLRAAIGMHLTLGGVRRTGSLQRGLSAFLKVTCLVQTRFSKLNGTVDLGVDCGEQMVQC